MPDLLRCLVRLRRDRQLEVKQRAAEIAAAIADRPAVRADDAVADREAEPGALADRLRREERLEQLRFVFAPHTGPAVFDLQHDAVIRVERPDRDAAIG